MSVTLGALVQLATRSLKDAGIDGAARDARLLVAHVAGLPLHHLTLEASQEVGETQQVAAQDLVARRIAREPLSHLLGKRAFFEHEFIVTPDTLDPRPETEALVLAALKTRFTTVLDMGTGTGAIALSLLAARPNARGVATDLSQAALDVAAQNAQAIGVAARVELVQSDWFAQVSGAFDLIVSNPPYIALEEMAELAPELSHEPRMALTDEADGLSAYRIIVAGAVAHLTDGGHLMVEIGWQQGAAVAALFEAAGLQQVAVLPDLDGRDRVVIGQKGTNLV